MPLLLRRQAELPEIAHVKEHIMSVQSAKALVEKLKADPEFGKQLEQEENIDKRVEIMKDAGFDFSKEEFRQAVMEMSSDSGELSDDDLAAVAGGKSGTWVGVGTGAASGAAAAAAGAAAAAAF